MLGNLITKHLNTHSKLHTFGLYMKTPKDEIFRILRSHPQIKFTVKDLIDESEFSEKTLRKYLDELVNEKKIMLSEEEGTFYYVASEFDTERGEVEPFISTDKITEIASKYSFINDINNIGVQKIHDFILSLNPKEVINEYIGDLESQIKNIECKPRKTNEDYSQITSLKREIYTLKNGLQPLDDTFIQQLDGGDIGDLIMVGTDASKKDEQFMIRIQGIPVFMHLTFSVAAGVVKEIKDGKIAPHEPQVIRKPEKIRTAAEDYLEDLSMAFTDLDERERSAVSYTIMNNVHYIMDQEAISRWRPNYLFHDGPLLPSHIDFKDLMAPGRDRVTWKSINSAIELKTIANLHQINMLGVVKTSNKRRLCELLDYALEQKFQPLWKRNKVKIDLHILEFLLYKNEVTTTFKENPFFSYVFDDKYGDLDSQSVNVNTIEHQLTTRGKEAYFRSLQSFTFNWFYLRDRINGLTRYDFYDVANNDELKKHGGNIGSKYATPNPVGVKSSFVPLEKTEESLPEVLMKAHTESNEWREIVAEHIKDDLRRAFNVLYGKRGG